MQNQLVAESILIGTVDNKLEQFSDQKELIKQGGYTKINAIRIFYTDKYVRGFEIFYKLKDGDLLKAGHNTPKKKKQLQSAVLEIGPDDYLSEIQGAYSEEKNKKKITNITFLTYRGKAGTYGGVGGIQFNFGFPGHTFGAFEGGFKKNIEWLKIQVLPLPKQFLDEITKVKVNVVVQEQRKSQPYYGNIGAIQKPTINFGQSKEEFVFQAVPPQPAQNMLSSKYPTFNSNPNQSPVQQQQQFSAQPQYPYGQVGINQNYPGQMNFNPYQKPQ